MKIIFKKTAEKALGKLDNQVRTRILKYLNKVSHLDNPRSLGKPLVENLRDFWRYRIGDYRVLCHIEDNELVIEVVKIGHRRGIYDD